MAREPRESQDESDWKIPDRLQPHQDRCAFELDRALRAVVGIKSSVPPDAFTAQILGTERSGSGVMIGRSGLVLTIGYLITEAETVWLTTAAGVVPADVVAIDQPTGFGLVQALGRIEIPALELGNSASVEPGAQAVFASFGGRHHAVSVSVIARQPFAGYWEYMLERPIFTNPPHPFWGGGGLIGPDGKLLGIGSLIVQRAAPDGTQIDMNMVVPIELLTPILDELMTRGRSSAPPRPWLGIYCGENEGSVFVQRVSPGGPADKANVRAGDRIVSVGGTEVADLISLWRAIWSRGAAGAAVPLKLARERGTVETVVSSADRTSFFKAPRLH